MQSAFHFWGKNMQKKHWHHFGRAKPESTVFFFGVNDFANEAQQIGPFSTWQNRNKTEQNACNKCQRQVNWVMMMARALRPMIPFHSKYLTIAFYFCCSAIVVVFLSLIFRTGRRCWFNSLCLCL